MKLSHSFEVPLDPASAWEVLTDLERVVKCMPGASITEIHGDNFRGAVTMKVGPFAMNLTGKGSWVTKDEATHTVSLAAEGDDGRGTAGAGATVTAVLVPEGQGTRVDVETDLMVSGRAAQFGGGVIREVSNKLMAKFAENLSAELAGMGEVSPLTSAPGVRGAPSSATSQPPLRVGASVSRADFPSANVLLAGLVVPLAFLAGWSMGAHRELRRAVAAGWR